MRCAYPIVLLALACGSCVAADGSPILEGRAEDPAPDPEVAPEGAPRSDRIVGPWYMGGRLSVSTTLLLHEDGRFESWLMGCMGPYGTESGSWRRDGERLVFHAEETWGAGTPVPSELRIVTYEEPPPGGIGHGRRRVALVPSDAEPPSVPGVDPQGSFVR